MFEVEHTPLVDFYSSEYTDLPYDQIREEIVATIGVNIDTSR